MTQKQEAFEEYARGRLDLTRTNDNTAYLSYTTLQAFIIWQASREQLKANLLSDEMINVLSGHVRAYGDRNEVAKAALEAIVREI
jgi:hypothetical protein